jgi:hypothetical protein
MSDAVAVAAITGAATGLVAMYAAKKQADSKAQELEAELEKIRLENQHRQEGGMDRFKEYRRGVYNGFLHALDRLLKDPTPEPDSDARTVYYQALLASGQDTAELIEEL